jgi:hypothetical protein
MIQSLIKFIVIPCLLASCSTVSVTRTANGSLHAGVTSFVGQQGIQNSTITTREGDVIVLNGYTTQNPDPETTKLVRDGVLIKAGIEAAKDLTQPAAEAVGNVIAP